MLSIDWRITPKIHHVGFGSRILFLGNSYQLSIADNRGGTLYDAFVMDKTAEICIAQSSGGVLALNTKSLYDIFSHFPHELRTFHTYIRERIIDSTGVASHGSTVAEGDLPIMWAPSSSGIVYDDVVFDFKGPRGDKGPKGDKGDKGDQGDKGPQGDQGPQGPQGDQGDQGPQGSAAQLQGIKGPQGDPGPVGPQGPMGDQGIAGADGVMRQITEHIYSGKQGKRGETGDQGPQGDPGIGVPQNGEYGQFLVKKSDADFAFVWETMKTAVKTFDTSNQSAADEIRDFIKSGDKELDLPISGKTAYEMFLGLIGIVFKNANEHASLTNKIYDLESNKDSTESLLNEVKTFGYIIEEDGKYYAVVN